jgi:hypothetical protein
VRLDDPPILRASKWSSSSIDRVRSSQRESVTARAGRLVHEERADHLRHVVALIGVATTMSPTRLEAIPARLS